ncbi:MAG: zinc-binding dehydrogenase [Planctomycetota bacterium]
MDSLDFRIAAPGCIALVPISNDAPFADDEIEGTMIASAVSPGTELNWAYATQDPTKPASGTGYAAVFRVDRAGPTSGANVGEIRFGHFGHGSRVRCKAARSIRVPDGVDAVSAALSRLAAVSWSTLTTTQARPPEWVAITGLGIIGNFAAQMFAAAGYRVLACDPVAARREFLAGRGIELCERLPIDDPTWKDKITMVVECAGHEAAVRDACRMVRIGGEVVLVGVPWKQRADIQSFDILHAVFHRYVHLRSGWEWEVPPEPTAHRHGSLRDNAIAAMEWLGSGRMRTDGFVRRGVNPRDVQQVYRDLQAQHGGMLTAGFDWRLL